MMKAATRAIYSIVMRGLDPRIHDARLHGNTLHPSLWSRLMDCRVKPGNDGEVAVLARTFACSGGT